MIITETKVKIITLTPSGNKVFDRSIDRSIDRLVDWLIDWLIHVFIHSCIHSFIHSFMLTQFRLVTFDLWHLTCDIWLVTFECCWQWVMTMTLNYVNNFKVLPMNGDDNSGLILCKLTPLCLQLYWK